MFIIKEIASSLFIIFFAFFLGRLFLPPPFKKKISICVGLGFVIISYSIFLLGILKLLNPIFIFTFSLVIFILLLIYNLKDKKIFFFSKNKPDKLSRFLILITFLYLSLTFLCTLTPPVSADALNYHLYLPKLWLKEKKIFTIPFNIYSFFPQGWEMLYLYAFIVGGEISAKLLHFSSLFLILFLFYYFFKDIFSLNSFYPLISFLIFISTPSVMRVASWAYVDVIQAFYILLSLYLLLFYFKKEEKTSLYLSAIFLGFAISIKYLTLIWLIFFFLLFLEESIKKRIAKFTILKQLLFYFFLIFLFSSPFYLRNFLETGNPFYPFFYNIFDGEFLNPEKSHLLSLYFESFGYGRSFKDLILLPLRLSFFAQFGNPYRFDGVIGIIYLVALIIITFNFKKINLKILPRSFFYFPVIFVLTWFKLSQQARFLIPLLALLSLVFTVFIRQINSSKINLVFSILFSLNLRYPFSFFMKEKPYLFLVGKETRAEYITRHIYIYPLIEKINKLPSNSKIMLINIGPVGFYLERDFYQEAIFEDYTFKNKLRKGITSLIAFLKKEKITHILIGEQRTKKSFLSSGFHREFLKYLVFKKGYLKKVLQKGDFILYKITF
ncbi:MAG: hypothetical protein B6D56_03920 [Candidatus Omnitrophica bacterium 4484_70.1]|nr:MAG: hypothetical protein B6D56_03920 [Candidatus Omnitrophica bacterium 4484_70.1]